MQKYFAAIGAAGGGIRGGIVMRSVDDFNFHRINDWVILTAKLRKVTHSFFLLWTLLQPLATLQLLYSSKRMSLPSRSVR